MKLTTLFPESSPEPKRSLALKIQDAFASIKQTFDSFTGALLLSTFSHLLLIFLLSLTAVVYYPAPPEARGSSDLNLFARALDELTKEKGLEEQLTEVINHLQEEQLPAIADSLLVLDDSMTEAEKLEVYKKLLEAYFSGDSRISLSGKSQTGGRFSVNPEESFEIRSGEKIYLSPSASDEGKFELYKLDSSTYRQLKNFQQSGGFQSSPKVGPGQIVKLKTKTQFAEVPAEYYYRTSPYEEIMAKGSMNFSIVKGFAPMAEEKTEEKNEEKLPETQAEEIFPQSGFKVIYYGQLKLPEPKISASESKIDKNRIFNLPKDRWEEKLDELMAYPEEEQFRIFEQEYLQKFDWNSAALAEFTRSFINSNLNGVFLIHDPFTTAFDSLEELFYKKQIFERIAALVEKYPQTRVSDELLFCLASSYDFEKRVIGYLNRAYPEASEVYLKKSQLDYVFNSLAKALTIKNVYEKLLESLKRKGFSSIDEALSRYIEQELKIYEQLAERGGKTRARALYAIGLTYWEKGDKERALKTWHQIEEKDCPASLVRFVRLLKETAADRLFQEIELELNYESSRNSKYLYQRSLTFHKWSRRT
ncbi:MAG: hypothetical protein H5U06_06490 [Candidatus Aminicenantes bacterium]|nr:hypothetical protein [Candidatus Aminicenantes bacterium]